jgi:hypothetical protein
MSRTSSLFVCVSKAMRGLIFLHPVTVWLSLSPDKRRDAEAHALQWIAPQSMNGGLFDALAEVFMLRTVVCAHRPFH